MKKIIAENFPNLERDVSSRFRKVKGHQSHLSQPNLPPRCLIIKISQVQDKGKTAQASKGKKQHVGVLQLA
jgi:hypothetical protein